MKWFAGPPAARFDGGLDGVLSGIADALPRDCGLAWETGPDGLLVGSLDIPLAFRGIGTGIMADLLSEADRHGIPVSLDACPTGNAGDPSLYQLVRWYRRFGFAVTGVTPQGWVSMHRVPRPWRGGQAVMRDYQGVRRHCDLTEDAFRAAVAEVAAPA
jgi:hypothetical protein